MSRPPFQPNPAQGLTRAEADAQDRDAAYARATLDEPMLREFLSQFGHYNPEDQVFLTKVMGSLAKMMVSELSKEARVVAQQTSHPYNGVHPGHVSEAWRRLRHDEDSKVNVGVGRMHQ
eukprot:GDKI01015256.1.p1 GENE.GDKI01015256.1~~GDKI01015256.1.p1  ORF type:complete len:119 (-),score=15.79 GDKI01015256.1:132-488(-)